MSDRPGFDEFVGARSPALLRTAYLLTSDRSLAEDLLQTALAKVWLRWPRLGPDPEPYVRKVLVTTYASWWRRRWRSELPHGELPDVATHEPHAAVDERDAVWAALARLPRRQRAVVVLRYFEDLSEAQTAELLDISVGTVKSTASRALARLRVDTTLQVDTDSPPEPLSADTRAGRTPTCP